MVSNSADQLYLFLLFPAGVGAGVVNVIAGGGSFVTLPILIATGLPVEVANATNRISIVLQGVYATLDYKRKGVVNGTLYRKLLPALLAGALLGAYLATLIPPDRLKRIFGVLFLSTGLYVSITALRALRQQAGAPRAQLPAQYPAFLRYGALFVVGTYGGFIQAGVGLWILLVATSLFHFDTVKVNAVKLPLTLTFTVPALLLFLHADLVRWVPGLVLAAGILVGTHIGVRVTLRAGAKLILPAVAVVMLITGAHLLSVR